MGANAFFGKTHSNSSPEQNRRVSTESETNSIWKATCVDLCQKCRVLPKRKAAILWNYIIMIIYSTRVIVIKI